MIARLRQAWSGRPPRERQVLVALAATVAVAAWLALVLAAQSAREPLLREVQALRDVSAGMDRQARERDQLRRLPGPGPRKAGGHDQEAGVGCHVLQVALGQKCQCLQGFAKAHVIGQKPTEAGV